MCRLPENLIFFVPRRVTLIISSSLPTSLLLIEVSVIKTKFLIVSEKGGHFARKAVKLQITPPGQQAKTKEQQQPHQNSNDVATGVKSARRLFGEDQCYVIDAKSYGNIGRYLNVCIVEFS